MKCDVKVDWTELLVMILLIAILSMPFAADAGGEFGLAAVSPPPASSDWRA